MNYLSNNLLVVGGTYILLNFSSRSTLPGPIDHWPEVCFVTGWRPWALIIFSTQHTGNCCLMVIGNPTYQVFTNFRFWFYNLDWIACKQPSLRDNRVRKPPRGLQWIIYRFVFQVPLWETYFVWKCIILLSSFRLKDYILWKLHKCNEILLTKLDDEKISILNDDWLWKWLRGINSTLSSKK